MNDNSKDNKQCLIFCRKDAFFDTEYPNHEQETMALVAAEGYTTCLTITEVGSGHPCKRSSIEKLFAFVSNSSNNVSAVVAFSPLMFAADARCAAHIYFELKQLNVEMKCVHEVG